MKRFYREVSVEPVGALFQVTLDGRPVKTQGRHPQLVPTRALAEALAEEWSGQSEVPGEEIDPTRLFCRDLADYAIDMVSTDRAAAIAEIMPYAETDTLCYRADPEDPLYRRQQEVWEPLLAQFELRHGLCFERVSGIIHRAQRPTTLARLRDLLEGLDPFTLAALKTLASLATSLVIGLSALEPDAEATSLWDAANLEEDWEVAQWGRDTLAEHHRALRLEAFGQAVRFAQLLRHQPL